KRVAVERGVEREHERLRRFVAEVGETVERGAVGREKRGGLGAEEGVLGRAPRLPLDCPLRGGCQRGRFRWRAGERQRRTETGEQRDENRTHGAKREGRWRVEATHQAV